MAVQHLEKTIHQVTHTEETLTELKGVATRLNEQTAQFFGDSTLGDFCSATTTAIMKTNELKNDLNLTNTNSFGLAAGQSSSATSSNSYNKTKAEDKNKDADDNK